MRRATRSTNTPPSEQQGSGAKGKRVGIAYELENGEINLCTRIIKQNGKNEKRSSISLICCLTATLGWAQEKNAYTLFDAQGNRVDYTQMMDVLERQDVVFIGEIHNCPIAHWMEYEIVKDFTTGTATG